VKVDDRQETGHRYPREPRTSAVNIKVEGELLMKKTILFGSIVALILGLTQAAGACTGIRLITEDGLVFTTRTLEFGEPVPTKLLVVPRGTAYQGTLPGNSPKGLKWTAQYGLVIMGMFNTPLAVDGINDQGLTAGYFLLPGYAEFQPFDPQKARVTLSHYEVVTWILSNFATAAEVRQALGRVQVCKGSLEGPGDLPVHISVHDARGKSLVIEYVAGQLHVYDNPLGVITNAPTFDWMLTNLNNYINLSPVNVPQRELHGMTLKQFGQGSGMVGLPGDFSPPSRFVRMVSLTQAAAPVQGAAAGLSLAMTIINNVDMPKGSVRQVSGTQTEMDVTQWVSLADLQGKKYYFRTYDNKNWRYVDMTKALQGATKIKSMSLDQPPDYPDVTSLAR
jgi:choloylglycine hydrolase